MFEALRSLVLRWMRVPHDPEPPAGDPKSVRVFRAAANFYKLRLFGWAVKQLFAVAGIVFWIWMLGVLERNVENTQQFLNGDAPPKAAPANATPAPASPPAPVVTASPDNLTAKAAAKKSPPGNRNARQLVQRVPAWLIWPLRALELFGIAGFLAQLPVTLAALRVDYELRWYIVTDRSLRIRSGIWRVQEMTMSFANIQQVAVTRDPIQGLLKICDVHVQSAGGGSSEPKRGHGGENMHAGVFHGVANAEEIRDLILERLRRFRAAGLGDPDDVPESHVAPATAATAHPALDAARELLAEARALREQLQSA